MNEIWKASEVYRRTREVLFERGWNHGGLIGEDGSLCLVGAINVAARGSAHLSAPFSLYKIIHQVVKGSCIASWNDAGGRTFDEVLEVLDRAEKLAEEREIS